MTLKELAVSYRRQSELIQERMRQVEALEVHSEAERIQKVDRLRILEGMRRDTRDLATICERYYDRDFRPNERYRICCSIRREYE